MLLRSKIAFLRVLPNQLYNPHAQRPSHSPPKKPPPPSRSIIRRATTQEVSGPTQPAPRLIRFHRRPAIRNYRQIQTRPPAPHQAQLAQTPAFPLKKLQVLPRNPIVTRSDKTSSIDRSQTHSLQPDYRLE